MGRSAQGELHRFDSPDAFNAPLGTGSFTFTPTSEDKDPDPRVGIYDVRVDGFRIDFAGSLLEVPEIAATARVYDNAGCDCFFIDVEYRGALAGQPFDRFYVNIQNEFGPAANTMFTDDSFPLNGLDVPVDSWTTINFLNGDDPDDLRFGRGIHQSVPHPGAVGRGARGVRVAVGLVDRSKAHAARHALERAAVCPLAKRATSHNAGPRRPSRLIPGRDQRATHGASRRPSPSSLGR